MSSSMRNTTWRWAINRIPKWLRFALFMEGWFGEGGSERHFPDAKLVIEPSARGKSVIDRDRIDESE